MTMINRARGTFLLLMKEYFMFPLRFIKKIYSDYTWIKGNILVLILSYILAGFSNGLYFGFEPTGEICLLIDICLFRPRA